MPPKPPRPRGGEGKGKGKGKAWRPPPATTGNGPRIPEQQQHQQPRRTQRVRRNTRINRRKTTTSTTKRWTVTPTTTNQGGGPAFPCYHESCTAEFAVHDDLLKHMREAHIRESEMEHTECIGCYNSVTNLEGHLRLNSECRKVYRDREDAIAQEMDRFRSCRLYSCSSTFRAGKEQHSRLLRHINKDHTDRERQCMHEHDQSLADMCEVCPSSWHPAASASTSRKATADSL